MNAGRLKTATRELLNDTTSGKGRITAFVIQGLIIASMVTFSLETLPHLSPASRQWLAHFELFTVAFFTLEYVLRIWTAERRLAFVFSFYGMVDLAAILPFYLTAGILDLRAVRAFRLLRLLRLLKLTRYSTAVMRFRLALRIAREELILFSLVALVLLYLSAVGIYYFERDVQPQVFASVFDALWWSVTTFTTVGYGDMYPVTTGGKLFTFVVLMVGLGIVAIPTGLVAAALSEARRQTQADGAHSQAATDTHDT